MAGDAIDLLGSKVTLFYKEYYYLVKQYCNLKQQLKAKLMALLLNMTIKGYSGNSTKSIFSTEQ